MKKIKVLFKFNDLIFLRKSDFDGIAINSDYYLANIENLNKIGLKTFNPPDDISKVLSVLKKPNLGYSFLFFGSTIFSEAQLAVLKSKSLPKINILNWVYTEFDKNSDAENFISDLKKYTEYIQYAYIGKDVKSPNFDSVVYLGDRYPNGGHLGAIEYNDALELFRNSYNDSENVFFGNNIKIAIVERSAILRFPNIDSQSYYEFDINSSNEYYRESGVFDEDKHGLNTIGVIKSKNDNQGSSGIAPDSEIYVSTFYGNNLFDYKKAISTAILSLICIENGAGVLLIELYTEDDEPMEVLPEVFELIETANHYGITTILPAGNSASGNNLNFMYSFRNIQISSAIMVGACEFLNTGDSEFVNNNTNLWGIHPTSNYGRRIDTYMCGENILTTTIRNKGGGIEYGYGMFGQTSGASAIIAGMVAAIQDVAITKYGTPLNSQQIKDLLRNNYQTSFYQNRFAAFQEWWNGGKKKKYQLPSLYKIILSIINP